MTKLQKLLKKIKSPKNYIIKIDNNDSYSGKKILELIITATEIFCKKNVYLEIGVFRGNTLINNAINNKNSICYGIDNFSLFNETRQNEKIVKNKIKVNNLKNVKLVNDDFENAVKKIKQKIGVLFIDGPHDYRSQLIALLKYEKLLAKDCIIIIDDANYFHVRKATQDFLETNSNYYLLMEKYTGKHIANSKNKKKFQNGYWNGINVISKYKTSNSITFQKNSDYLMKMFLISHEIFRHKFIFNALEILDLCFFFKKKKINHKFFIEEIKKIKLPKKISKQLKFRSQNTF